jgi:polyribonucleotide nucleotidyltransferase
MADIQEKNPSVELDTDGVNDQVIDVETPKESTSEFQQKEEVDLGYTDVSENKKTAKELLQEVKESEAKKQNKLNLSLNKDMKKKILSLLT